MTLETALGTPHRWLSVEEAARYLGCSRNFLDKDRVTQLHGIPFTRLGRHIRYDRLKLDSFLEAQSSESFREAV